jgi:hypothetical protein
MGKEITVYLDEDNAIMFREFQKYYEVFKAMLQAGAFHTINGEVKLNFNCDGILMNIEKRTVLYQRKRDK